jgi:DNA-binding response OmpR family regulator
VGYFAKGRVFPFRLESAGSIESTGVEIGGGAANNGARILLVEDDEEIVDVLRRTLRAEGFTVDGVTSGQDALDSVGSFLPDLLILDLGLPDIDGEEVCRRLRESQETSRLPILMLTARSELDDRVSGLDSGADDYLTKPFEREELLARVRALLRRTPPRGSDVLEVGNLRLLPDAREVERAGRSIELTKTEFELLEYLMRNERLVVSRERLLEEIWGYSLSSGDTNTLDVFISNLRRKLEEDGEPRMLHTKRGSGYMLKA